MFNVLHNVALKQQHLHLGKCAITWKYIFFHFINKLFTKNVDNCWQLLLLKLPQILKHWTHLTAQHTQQWFSVLGKQRAPDINQFFIFFLLINHQQTKIFWLLPNTQLTMTAKSTSKWDKVYTCLSISADYTISQLPYLNFSEAG